MLLFSAAQSLPKYLSEGQVWQKHSPFLFRHCGEDGVHGADLGHHSPSEKHCPQFLSVL